MCTMSQEAINDILRKGRVYEVGGAVRDRYLKPSISKDRDYLVTGVPYDDLTGILSRHGRVDLVGKSFGVIKFTQYRKGEAHTFDISLPRKEFSTGSGHKDFQVSFDPNLPVEDDLVRRDFTINALALSVDTKELVDPLHGLDDIEHRVLRMTSDKSFVDDPLRMLRAVQFAARFSFLIEPKTFASMRAHAGLVATVSAERIAEELTKLLILAERPSEGFRLMHEAGLLEEILPELETCVGVDQPGGFHAYDVFEHTTRAIDACPPKLHMRLAALFHDIRKPQAKRLTETGATFYGHEITGAKTARQVMHRLRFSNDLTDDVVTLVERHMYTPPATEKGLRRLVRRVGVDLIYDLLNLRRADVAAQGMGGKTDDVDELEEAIRTELSHKPPLGLGDLAIDGSDIMTRFDLKPGPQIGATLNYLLERVLDHPEYNTTEKLEALAGDFILNLDKSTKSVSDKDTEQ
jgi:tRNA nucleotidyltransferase (CCA-adding enzyme)